MIRRRTAIVLVPLVAMLMGCTSLRAVAPAEAVSAQTLRPGDEVVVTRRDAAVMKLTIVTVSPQRIEGTEVDTQRAVAVEMSDVERVERRSFDGMRTTLFVVAAVFGAYLYVQAAGVSALLAGL